MKTNKIWKVCVSAVMGMVMALWLVVPSAKALDLVCFIDEPPAIQRKVAECVIDELAEDGYKKYNAKNLFEEHALVFPIVDNVPDRELALAITICELKKNVIIDCDQN